MLSSSLFPFVLSRVHVLFMLSVFIYVYWWPTQFPCQKIFVSFNSTTTTEQQLLTLPEFAPGFSEVRVAQSFGFCVVFCRWLLVLLPCFWSLYWLSFNLRLLINSLVSFGHCIGCPSIYDFWLTLWYLVVIVLAVLQSTISD